MADLVGFVSCKYPVKNTKDIPLFSFASCRNSSFINNVHFFTQSQNTSYLFSLAQCLKVRTSGLLASLSCSRFQARGFCVLFCCRNIVSSALLSEEI